jgi:WD40 repeat protein
MKREARISNLSSTNKLYRTISLCSQENTMSKQFRIHLVLAAFLITTSIIGIATAASLAQAWKEPPVTDGSYFDVMFSEDGSTVYAGGNQMFVRSWDGTTRWGGRAGTVATMSSDGNYVVSAAGNLLQVLDRNGTVYWIRGTGAPIRAVAVSTNASLIISADEQGDIHSWTGNGESWGLNRSDLVKQIAVSPSQRFVVVTTVVGLKYLKPDMTPFWSDNKSGSLDSFIAISADSSTIITSGENRVSSHTKRGALNWMKDVTLEAIIDMACSGDCTTIVLGSQDGNIRVLDQDGKVLWTYPAGSWINGVGVSRDGSIIAAGTLDGNLYILDHYGNLLAKTRTESIIQQRSVAVSGDGKRVVVADQRALYGYDLSGEQELTSEETLTPEPLFPVTSPTPEKTTLPIILPTTKYTTPPETTGTQKSALSPLPAIVAITGFLFLVRKRII